MRMQAGETIARITYLTNEINAQYHFIAQAMGLSDSAGIVLYTLAVLGDGCLLSAVHRLSGQSRQTINSSIRRMEENGILYLEAENKRNKRICLTERGEALLGDTMRLVLDAENSVFARWTAAEQSEYVRLTQKYLDEIKTEFAKLKPRSSKENL